jgi:hypothetical protein
VLCSLTRSFSAQENDDGQIAWANFLGACEVLQADP